MYTIITTDECPWCTKAKDLLEELSLSYTEYDLADYPDLRDFFNKSDFRTVPQIFHRGKHIGGFSQLKFHLGE